MPEKLENELEINFATQLIYKFVSINTFFNTVT